MGGKGILVDKAEEIKTEILAHTPKKDNAAQLTRLKQAWKEAEAQNTRGLPTRNHVLC